MIVTRVVELSDGEELVLEADELVSKGHEPVKGDGRAVGKEEGRGVVEDPREGTIEVRRLAVQRLTQEKNPSVKGDRA